MIGAGSRFDPRLESTPATDTLGHLTLIRTTLSKISAEKRLIDTSREREAQLRLTQQMAAISAMAGGIAHDFNNLLMVILGNIEIAEDRVCGYIEFWSNLEQARNAGE